LDIPVIASGDIFSAQLAKKMPDETACDGLASARGSLGNPWIFKEIKEYLKTGKIILRPSLDEIIKIMLEHLDASVKFYGDRNGVVIFRKFFGWYTKGIRSIRPLREKSSRVKTKEEMAKIINLSK
jgi:tRNA-dihydrouridine synthase B